MAAKKKTKKSKKAPAKKAKGKKRVAKAARRAPAKKAAKRKAKSSKKTPKKVSAKKIPAKKAVKKTVVKTARGATKQYGEGNYKATQRFDKAQQGFVQAHKSEIPAMGKAAKAALEGPEGKDLMAAEDEAKGHAAGEEP